MNKKNIERSLGKCSFPPLMFLLLIALLIFAFKSLSIPAVYYSNTSQEVVKIEKNGKVFCKGDPQWEFVREETLDGKYEIVFVK